MDAIKPGAIILAAGASSRLGSPKQLVRFRGRTLLEQAKQTAAAAGCHPVVIVLGSDADLIKKETAGLSAYTVVNKDWRAGMSSSITTGLEKLLLISPEISAALLMLCDQPLLTSRDIRRLIDKFDPRTVPLVATRYQNSNGVPALFGKRFFPELLSLQGDRGARNLLNDSNVNITTVTLPAADFDIDTPADLHKLQTIN